MSAVSDASKAAIREAYVAIIEARGLAPRWGQRQMIAEVANTLARIAPSEPSTEAPDAAGDPAPAIAVIEAGTGTGKTIAYVLPAMIMARALGKRLVVATATVALQEQLVNKDLPDILAGSDLSFDFVLAKGRRRYLCLSQLDRILAQGSHSGQSLGLYPDELAPSLAQSALDSYPLMLDALGRGDWNGDRDSWPASIDDADWFPITADQGQCTGRRCPNIGQCSFYRARDGLQEADLVVTNHDLVLSDLSLGGGAILSAPEDTIYIFDEGHHLPDKALSHFATFCRLPSARAWLDEGRRALAKAAPLLGQLPGIGAVLEPLAPLFEDIAVAIEHAGDQGALLLEHSEDPLQLRFPAGRVPDSLKSLATGLAQQWGRLVGRLTTLESAIDDAVQSDDFAAHRDELEAWQMALGAMLSRAEGTLALWQDFAADAEQESPPRARWLRRRDGDADSDMDFHCSHILAADILREQLWDRAAGAILTSATLTALGSFDRFRARSGVPANANFKVVSSPFDYSRAILHIPAMRSEPSNAQEHTAELIELLPKLLGEDEGSLVLFSSRRQMLDVNDALPAHWVSRVLLQDSRSKQEILRRHREQIDRGCGSVILGLASFAEGVDLPGAYCRHVIIAKLPFAVPDDPVDSALAEWLEAQGRNAFMEISVPDAALRLLQASGRLLRTESDSGRVSLLDRRVVTRRYGRAILDSLPPFTRQID
ncbi:MAG: ATP-dependent DNA helicase DinG [Halieaceae bacterium]